jgi:hypothetical protein
MCLKIGPFANTAMNHELHKTGDILMAAIIGFTKETALRTYVDSPAINTTM